MARKKRMPEQRSAVEIAERIHMIAQLVELANQQLDRAKTDLGMARVGLTELEQELLARGASK